MKYIIILVFINIFYAQTKIETREFVFYKSIENNTIDFSDFISDINGIYEVKLIDLVNVNSTKIKQTILNQCEIKLTLTSKKDIDIYKSKDVLIKNIKGIDVSLCDDVLKVDNTFTITDKEPTIIININNYKEFSGEFIFWVTGKFSNSSNIKKNNNHGFLREWHDNEKLFIEYKFTNGKKNGIQKRWYTNGQQEILYNYHYGKLNGQQKSWYENGQIKATWNYTEDKQDGRNQEWYSNGNIKSIKIFDKGILVDVLEMNDVNGNAIN